MTQAMETRGNGGGALAGGIEDRFCVEGYCPDDYYSSYASGNLPGPPRSQGSKESVAPAIH